jgi:hypothetical protein
VGQYRRDRLRFNSVRRKHKYGAQENDECESASDVISMSPGKRLNEKAASDHAKPEPHRLSSTETGKCYILTIAWWDVAGDQQGRGRKTRGNCQTMCCSSEDEFDAGTG